MSLQLRGRTRSWVFVQLSCAVLPCLAFAAFAQPPAPPPPPAEPDREQLLERIDQLEERVGQLESTTVLSEPETRVRRIEVWVDENGIEYDEERPGTRPVVTYQRERVYRRQTISEKIEEALDDAASRSVSDS